MCCGSGVSCDQTPGSKMCICQKSCRTCTITCGTNSHCSWTTCGNMCSCCGLESVCGQVRKPLFKMNRRVPPAVKAQHGGQRVVFVVLSLLLNIFVLNCALADSIIIHRCRFRTGSSWFVVTVLVMLFGHHRRHKLAGCTCVALDVVVFLPCCFVHFAQRSVCPLRGLSRCICSFVLGVSNRLTVYRRISVP